MTSEGLKAIIISLPDDFFLLEFKKLGKVSLHLISRSFGTDWDSNLTCPDCLNNDCIPALIGFHYLVRLLDQYFLSFFKPLDHIVKTSINLVFGEKIRILDLCSLGVVERSENLSSLIGLYCFQIVLNDFQQIA